MYIESILLSVSLSWILKSKILRKKNGCTDEMKRENPTELILMAFFNWYFLNYYFLGFIIFSLQLITRVFF